MLIHIHTNLNRHNHLASKGIQSVAMTDIFTQQVVVQGAEAVILINFGNCVHVLPLRASDES